MIIGGMPRLSYLAGRRVAAAALVILVIATAANSAEVMPPDAKGTSSDFAQFNRTRTFSAPHLDSKLIAARFAPYQAFPLAWYDLPEEGYCFRLLHVHSGSSAPTSRGIVLELRGYRGRPALMLAEVDHTGVKWTTRMVSAATADEILDLVDRSRLLDPATQERPRYISAFNFYLEVRIGRRYQYIWRQAPVDDTDARGLGEFLAIVERLIGVAEIPNSEVFYGERSSGK